MLTQFSGAVYPTVFVIYAVNRYGWTTGAVGLCMAGFGVCSGLVQATLTGRAADKFGERKVILFGLICGAIGMGVFGLANSSLGFALAIPISTLAGIAGPAIMAMMTRRVEPWEQGQLQGANTALQSVAGIVAPLLFGWTYSLFIGPFRGVNMQGAPFMLAAVFMVISIVLCWLTFNLRGGDVEPVTAAAPAPQGLAH